MPKVQTVTKVKPDLAWLLRTYWPERIQPGLRSEVADIAEEYQVTPKEVLDAILECMAEDDERGQTKE